MKKIDKSYLQKKINKLNKKIHRAESQEEENKVWWRKIKLNKLKDKLFGIECNFEELNGIDFKKGCYVGQENTARIKLKNKLSKRLFPINVINGKLYQGESIYNNEIEIGKVLIDSDYPFALIKYLNENFDEKANFKTKEASIIINKPDWIKK